MLVKTGSCTNHLPDLLVKKSGCIGLNFKKISSRTCCYF